MKEFDQACTAPREGSLLLQFLRRLIWGRTQRDAAAAHSESASGSTTASRAPISAAQNAARILVVDDDPVILKTMGTKLTRAGFKVLTGLDGAEAIGIVRKENPDVVLLDVFFPPDVAHGGNVAWDGLGVLQWLKRMGGHGAPPVIIITGSDDEQIHERARASGARAIFQKPIDHERLIEEIRQTLEMKRMDGMSRGEQVAILN